MSMEIKSALTSSLMLGVAFTLPSLPILDAASVATCWATCYDFAEATGLVAFRLSSGPFTAPSFGARSTARRRYGHMKHHPKPRSTRRWMTCKMVQTHRHAPTCTDHSILIPSRFTAAEKQHLHGVTMEVWRSTYLLRASTRQCIAYFCNLGVDPSTKHDVQTCLNVSANTSYSFHLLMFRGSVRLLTHETVVWRNLEACLAIAILSTSRWPGNAKPCPAINRWKSQHSVYISQHSWHKQFKYVQVAPHLQYL